MRRLASIPITPASGILMQMMRELPRAGGVAIQGEDEIASIGMCLGAAMAGAKAMTATSGPGISLYSENIGLAVMGQNLILNMNDHGYTVVAYNRTVEKVEQFLANEAKDTRVIGASSIEDMVAKLKRPRRVMMLVKAGQPVDDRVKSSCRPSMVGPPAGA